MEAVIGVDPHKYVLSAVALDGRGGVLGHWHGETSSGGPVGAAPPASRLAGAGSAAAATAAVQAATTTSRPGGRIITVAPP